MAVRHMLVAGRYRLHEPVGTGGMGRVWLARDEMLDRDVAVKEFVPPDWMSDDEKNRLRTKTLREARSAARLNHPHVVRIYDVVHADDLPWIVMEYVPSRSLYQVIGDDGPFDPAAAARIGLHVLDALSAAHRAGVLHRDIKPHNVLIGHDDRVVLTDFGLATFVDDGSVTSPGMVVGSPQYVSPERARDGASTVEADLWSLGATLYAAVEGRSPYARDSAMATLMALASEEPDPPVLAGPLAPVLAGLLRRDPAARLTADEVEDGLRAVLAAGQRSAAPRPSLPAPPPGLPAPRPNLPAPRRPVDADRAGPDAAPSRTDGTGAAPAALARSEKVRRLQAEGLPPATAIRRANQAPAAAGRPPAGHAAPVSPAPAARPQAPPVAIELPGPRSDERPPSRTDPPSGRIRSRRRLAMAGAALVALLVLGGVGYGVLRGDGKAGDVRGAPVVSGDSSGQGGGNFSPSVCGGAPAADLPRTPQPNAATSVNGREWKLLKGYSYFKDPSGFNIAVPDGWTYQRIGTTMCFRDPDGVRILSVDPARNPTGDPIKACRAEATRLVAAGDLPGYENLGITKVPLFGKAADWEYTYEGDGGTRMHAMTRWFAADGKAFALGWVTREFDWPLYTTVYQMLKSTFYVSQPSGRRHASPSASR